jgi:hypothetical protein
MHADDITQAQLAAKIRRHGAETGVPNECSRGNVARWLAGAVPQQHYITLLTAVLGRTAAQLGLAPPPPPPGAGRDGLPLPTDDVSYGPLTGIWLSTYTWHSDSRGADFTERHHCTILHRGGYLAVRSLPRQVSQMSAGLWAENGHATGAWAQRTAAGRHYSGAAQLEIHPAGTVLSGKWVGFGARPGEINTGDWLFALISTRIDEPSQLRWDIPPGDARDAAIEAAMTRRARVQHAGALYELAQQEV